MIGRLDPGPMRDLLGLLVQATRGGDSLTIHDLCERTGVGFVPMRERVYALVEAGHAVVAETPGGVTRFQATDTAAAAVSS